MMALRTLRTVSRGIANLSGRSTFATAAKGAAAKSAKADVAVAAAEEPSAPDVWQGPGPLDAHGVKCEDVIVKINNESVSRFANATNEAESFSNERNAIQPFDLAWVMDAKMNKSGIDRRCAEFGTRRSIKKNWQAAWLLRAVTNVDLTTLAGDDTPGKVDRMCAKAVTPVRRDILRDLGVSDAMAQEIKCAAVCVYPSRVRDAVTALEGTGIPVASVATGFPAGQIKHEHKLEEIRQAVADGATEIDIVINRQAALCGDWETVHGECAEFREACGDAHMKAILAVGELATLTNIHRASLACMMAGADFIKTSTGKEKTNAALPNTLVMARAIRDYLQTTGFKVGLKVAGGVTSAKAVLAYQALMKEELGSEWLHADLFRIGASTLVTDIERQLHHQSTGQYAADYYMALS